MGSNRSTGRLDPQAKRHIDDLFPGLADALSASEAVQGLLAHPGWSHAQALIDIEVETINRRLDSGGEPHSRAEYAKAHGRRGGLLYLREALDAIVQRAEQRYSEQQRKHEGVPERTSEEAMA